MEAAQILDIIREEFGPGAAPDAGLEAQQPWIEIDPRYMQDICIVLRDDPRFYFDFLQCLSGVDYGPDENLLGAVYHLHSIPYGHSIVLKMFVERIPNKARGPAGASGEHFDHVDLSGPVDIYKLVNTGIPVVSNSPIHEIPIEYGAPDWPKIDYENLEQYKKPAGDADPDLLKLLAFKVEKSAEDGDSEAAGEDLTIEIEEIQPKILWSPKRNPKGLPPLPSVSHIWRTAEWHEREAYDLLGIWFDGNPDPRRILMPEDWEGYPLRKDYRPQELYHGVKVNY